MRRGRKRMELVRMKDRNRNRPSDGPAGDIYLTRRMFIFKGLFVTGFAALIAKLGKMQMVDARQYEGAASGNITRFEPVSASRGLIVDRKLRILAENRVSWTVKIVPLQLPDDQETRDYVRQQLITALDLKESLVVRKNGLPVGTEDVILTDLAAELGEDPTPMIRWVRRQAPDNLVRIREDLTPDDVTRFSELAKRWPGVEVMNHIDYVIELNSFSAVPVVVKADVARDVALALESNQLFLPGVVVSSDALARRYPAGPEFSHILGYVGPINAEEYEAAETAAAENPYLRTDMIGRGGLEEAMEESLRGQHGGRWVHADARGVEIAEITERRREPNPGRTVELTIDRDFQRAATQALQEGINIANEDALKEGKEPVGSGVAVAIDPQTGEILALVSLPNYDNQLFVDGISSAQYQAYLDDPYKPLTNFAISGAFPPGSTIKPFYACAGLHEGTITEETHYYCAGTMRVPTVDDETGGRSYVCWNPAGHGPIALREAISESCDIYFYNVGAPNQTPEGASEPLHYYNPGDPQPHYFEGLGIDLMNKHLREQFGFGEPTGIELAAESPGLVPTPKWLFQSPLREYWSVGDTINVSIGQGHLSCTPLQLACATAAIANGGIYYRPRLVRALRGPNGEVVREFEPEAVRNLAYDRSQLEIIRESMELTIREGSGKGKFTRTQGVVIAGKSGTAEFGEAEDGKYKKQHAWFTAFAPYDRPTIAVAVLITGGGGGATYASPVCDAILAAYFGQGDA